MCTTVVDEYISEIFVRELIYFRVNNLLTVNSRIGLFPSAAIAISIVVSQTK